MTSNSLLILPIALPFLSAIFSLLLWKVPRIHRFINVAGAMGLLAVSLVLLATVINEGILVSQIGNWQAPFGISFVADIFSAIMVVLAAITGFAVAIYSLVNIDAERERFGYYPLMHILVMGVCGAFLTGDIFNLYVWFEVMLMASFVLMALGGERAQLEGAIKYVTLNLISSVLFLSAVGVLYGIVGTLNMADIAMQLRMQGESYLTTVVSMLFFVTFGIKAAIFPLFFWLPASYHTPPVAVSAIFAGLLTKVGVYALLRVFSLIFVHDVQLTHTIILVSSGFTMVVGVLGAAAQSEFRRILSFHIVSQIGYMIMGLGMFTPMAVAGSIFYIIHHIIVKANLFLVSGIVKRIAGSFDLKFLGGMYKTSPLLSVCFLIPAFSLAGIPPLSGFWAKLALVKAGLEIEQFVIVAVALGVSLLTLFSMTKIWEEVFWKPVPQPLAGNDQKTVRALVGMEKAGYFFPVLLLALMTVAIGVFSEPLFALSKNASEQLMNPDLYIDAVLKKR